LTTNPGYIDADGIDNTVGTLDDNFDLPLGSPAIDIGNNANVPGALTTDFLGRTRITNGDAVPGAVVDLGAYEYQPPVPPAQTMSYNAALAKSFTCQANGLDYKCHFAVEQAGFENGKLYTLTQTIAPAVVGGGGTVSWVPGEYVASVQFTTTYTGASGAIHAFYLVLYQANTLSLPLVSSPLNLNSNGGVWYVEYVVADRTTGECTRSYFIYNKTTQTISLANNPTQPAYNGQNLTGCDAGFAVGSYLP
jgi:hypothetical protein